MLHILNGDAVLDIFLETGIGKDFAIWRELLCQGPTMVELDTEAALASRNKFFTEFLGLPENEYLEKWSVQIEKIKTADTTEVTLWFEYDLFCQFNMMAAIYFINSLNRKWKIYLINVGKTLNQKDWITLGQLSAEEWLEVYNQKKLLLPSEIEWMCQAWEIYCSSSHQDFDDLVDTCPAVFKYFPQAIENHFRRFHSRTDGLTDIQRFILNKLRLDGTISQDQLLKELMVHFHYYGYGDLQYRSMLRALFFIELEGNEYHLKIEPTGSKLLAKLPEMVYGGTSNRETYVEDFIKE